MFGFGFTQVGLFECDLALQIGDLDLVVVDQRHVPNPGGPEVEGYWATQTASTDHQHSCGLELGLACDIKPGHQDLATVAQQFLIVQHLVFSQG